MKVGDMQDAIIEKLIKLKRQHEYLSKELSGSISTLNTQNKSPVAVTTELDIQNLEGDEQ